VWDEFRRILTVSGPPHYEAWVICCQAGRRVQSALQSAIQNLQSQDPNLRNLQFRTLTDFLPEVRATIGRWRQAHPVPATGAGLPGSKWLLLLLDYMVYYGFWP
jgi:hypothetical protein